MTKPWLEMNDDQVKHEIKQFADSWNKNIVSTKDLVNIYNVPNIIDGNEFLFKCFDNLTDLVEYIIDLDVDDNFIYQFPFLNGIRENLCKFIGNDRIQRCIVDTKKLINFDLNTSIANFLYKDAMNIFNLNRERYKCYAQSHVLHNFCAKGFFRNTTLIPDRIDFILLDLYGKIFGEKFLVHDFVPWFIELTKVFDLCVIMSNIVCVVHKPTKITISNNGITSIDYK